MFTQADAAEKVLEASDGPMHYKAIVEAAIRLGLITRTEENAKWFNHNVRKAVDTDPRFIKIDRGVFNLAARQPSLGNPQQIMPQKDVTPMNSPHLTDDVARKMEEMLSTLDKTSGVMETPMEKVRDVFGQRRNGPLVAQQIEMTLRHYGLGHFPVSLNVKQHVPVILYRLDSVAGRHVKAASQGSETGDKYLQALDKIGEIVQSLEADEQL